MGVQSGSQQQLASHWLALRLHVQVQSKRVQGLHGSVCVCGCVVARQDAPGGVSGNIQGAAVWPRARAGERVLAGGARSRQATHLLLSTQVQPLGGESRAWGAEPCARMLGHCGSWEATRGRPTRAASAATARHSAREGTMGMLQWDAPLWTPSSPRNTMAPG